MQGGAARPMNPNAISGFIIAFIGLAIAGTGWLTLATQCLVDAKYGYWSPVSILDALQFIGLSRPVTSGWFGFSAK